MKVFASSVGVVSVGAQDITVKGCSQWFVGMGIHKREADGTREAAATCHVADHVASTLSAFCAVDRSADFPEDKPSQKANAPLPVRDAVVKK